MGTISMKTGLMKEEKGGMASIGELKLSCWAINISGKVWLL